MSDLIGTVVGNYRVIAKLASGGMGIVYRAEHRSMGQAAVVKQLLPDFVGNAEVVTRFFHEARAAAAIDDPGTVKIFDQGTLEDGSAYIIMELLRGESLAQRLKRGPIAPAQAVTLLRQAARAVGAAHARGIVHRDLKPDNLFLVPDPEVPGGERIKVLDFGIAKLRDHGAAHVQTAMGVPMGTPAYMSPEQWVSAGNVDERTDIYALGCILYEMLTGKPPYRAPSIPALMDQHRSAAPPSPESGTPLDAVVLRCLAKPADDRFHSMDELARALPDRESLPGVAATVGGLAETLPPDATPAPEATPAPARSAVPEPERARPTTRRRAVVLVGAGGACAVGVVGYLLLKPTTATTTTRSADASVATSPEVVARVAIGPCARVGTEETAVTGPRPVAALTKDVIERYVRQYQPGIAACDRRRGSTSPIKLHVTFAVMPEGTTGEIHTEGTSDATLARCIDEVVGGMHFPKPATGAAVVIQRYPIALPPPPLPAQAPTDVGYPASVAEVLVDQTPALMTCYQHALATRPGLAGIAALELQLDRQGVLDAKVSGLSHDGLESCLAERIKTARFPAPSEPHPTLACSIALASNAIPPVADGAIVTLERGRVAFGGARIDLPPDAETSPDLEIPALREAMRVARRRLGTSFFTIEGSDDVDVRLVMHVLYSGTLSGFGDVQLARGHAGRWEAIPAVVRLAGTLDPDRVTIAVTPIEIVVRHGTTTRKVDVRRGAIDADALGRALEDFKRADARTQLQLHIAAQQDTEYDVIASLVATAASHGYVSLSLGPAE